MLRHDRVCPKPDGARSNPPPKLSGTDVTDEKSGSQLSLYVSQNGCSPLRTKTHNTQQRRQVWSMVMITLIPIITLLVLSLIMMVNSSSETAELDTVRNKVGSSIKDAGDLVHSLQIERGLTALYLSSREKNGLLNMYAIYNKTNKAIEKISWNRENDGIETYFNSQEDFKAHLDIFRESVMVSGVNLSISAVVDFYTRDIDIIINWLSEDIKVYSYGDMWMQLIAYLMLIRAKEHTGKERALGGTFYARGGFSLTKDYLLYINETIMANTYLNIALQLSLPLQEAFAIDENLSTSIEKMRSEILLNDHEELQPSIVRGTSWFYNMSQYINVLLDLQKGQAKLIVEKLEISARYGNYNVLASALLFVVVLTTGPMIVLGIIWQTKCIQQVNEALHLKTEELEKQKKRADSLLYQMLPKIVAEQLKQTGTAPAETYDEVTVFFSDVVNFTAVSAISTPIQVIVMLNTLYQCLDGIIERYDVYKVETIGDAYMVVSGVPNRNGKKHAPEMARLSLAICSGVSTVHIPHLPEQTFKLRIGIHTGPCAAGVVGSTRPRYCLFGDTINTASRMESTGKPGKIHISQAMRDALVRCDERFVIVLNGTLNIKGKGKMTTYFLDGGFMHQCTAELEDQTNQSVMEDKL